MKDFIKLLEKLDIDFKVKENEILIPCPCMGTSTPQESTETCFKNENQLMIFDDEAYVHFEFNEDNEVNITTLCYYKESMM